jgi:hypothetical protein
MKMIKISDVMIDLNPWWKEEFTLEYHEKVLLSHMKPNWKKKSMEKPSALSRLSSFC